MHYMWRKVECNFLPHYLSEPFRLRWILSVLLSVAEVSCGLIPAQMSFCKENVKTRFLHLLVCRESAPARKINCVFNVNNVWSSLSSAARDFRVLHFSRIILFYWAGKWRAFLMTLGPLRGETRFMILLDPGRGGEILTMTWRLQYYTITQAQYTTPLNTIINYSNVNSYRAKINDDQRVGGIIQIHDWSSELSRNNNGKSEKTLNWD